MVSGSLEWLLLLCWYGPSPSPRREGLITFRLGLARADELEVGVVGNGVVGGGWGLTHVRILWVLWSV